MSRGLLVLSVSLAVASAVSAQQRYVPEVGQEGKDVIWVPTPPELVEKMLDLAKVTPSDHVVDLGSGDGRNVIAAAKRGAHARGVEFNPEMVALSSQLASDEHVGEKAVFVQGDMFAADFSDATVLALFLLPDNLDRLKPKFLDLEPGTRIVLNTFGITGWTADETEQVPAPCATWCTALLYYVPAKVGGTWRAGDGVLTLTQEYQKIGGALVAAGTSTPIVNGRLRGDHMTFSAGESVYSGRVNGDTVEGVVSAGGQTKTWRASRAR